VCEDAKQVDDFPSSWSRADKLLYGAKCQGILMRVKGRVESCYVASGEPAFRFPCSRSE